MTFHHPFDELTDVRPVTSTTTNATVELVTVCCAAVEHVAVTLNEPGTTATGGTNTQPPLAPLVIEPFTWPLA